MSDDLDTAEDDIPPPPDSNANRKVLKRCDENDAILMDDLVYDDDDNLQALSSASRSQPQLGIRERDVMSIAIRLSQYFVALGIVEGKPDERWIAVEEQERKVEAARLRYHAEWQPQIAVATEAVWSSTLQNRKSDGRQTPVSASCVCVDAAQNPQRGALKRKDAPAITIDDHRCHFHRKSVPLVSLTVAASYREESSENRNPPARRTSSRVLSEKTTAAITPDPCSKRRKLNSLQQSESPYSDSLLNSSPTRTNPQQQIQPGSGIFDLHDDRNGFDARVRKKPRLTRTHTRDVFAVSPDGPCGHAPNLRSGYDADVDGDEEATVTQMQLPRRQYSQTKSIIFRNDNFYGTLGRLRVQESDFKWGEQEPYIYSNTLGRAYYRSFVLRGVKITIGLPVRIDRIVRSKARSKRREWIPEFVLVLAAFQATKSFEGLSFPLVDGARHKETRVCELQKRGCPYVIALTLEKTGWDRKGKPIFCLKEEDFLDVPTYLLDPHLRFRHADGSLDGAAAAKVVVDVASLGWPTYTKAQQVYYVSEKHEELFFGPDIMDRHQSKPNGIPFRLAESSDDSDDFDSESERCIHMDYDVNMENWSRITAEDTDDESTESADELESIVDRDKSRLVLDSIWQPSEDIYVKAEQKDIRRLLKARHVSADLIDSVCKAAANTELEKMMDVEFDGLGWTADESVLSTVDLKRLEKACSEMGIKNLKPLQRRICVAAIQDRTRDILVSAPCGFGKSMTFMLPALVTGGITVVIVPLKALTESLLKEMGKRKIACEKLLRYDEARGNEKRALDRLQALVDAGKQSSTRIIVTTPELIQSDDAIAKLANLAELGSLERIVVDEFDLCVKEATNTGREAYATIVPQIQKSLKNTPLMFLSATASKSVVKLVVAHDRPRPKLFVHGEPLPKRHFYLVEPKKGRVQVAARIGEILAESPFKNGKAICYFISKSDCQKFSEILEQQQSIKSNAFVGAKTEEEKKANASTLKEFIRGGFQVLCANGALGRGVDNLPKDVRFCFHVEMPQSLDEYLQQTGRAGRDGDLTFCYLFYRTVDRFNVAKVLSDGKGEKSLGELTTVKFDGVMDYAWNGSVCRRQVLASCTLVKDPYQVSCKEVGCILCDNCLVRNNPAAARIFKKEVTASAIVLLQHMATVFKSTDLGDSPRAKSEASEWHKCARLASVQNSGLAKLVKCLLQGRSQSSMMQELSRYMSAIFKTSEEKMTLPYLRSNWIACLLKKLEVGSALGIVIKGLHIQTALPLKLCIAEASKPPEEMAGLKNDLSTASALSNVYDFEQDKNLPIIIQFGLQKCADSHIRNQVRSIYIQQKSNSNECLSKACEMLGTFPRNSMVNFRLLAQSETEGSGLFWKIKLGKDGELEPGSLFPDVAHNRRIFRMFQSDRFLFVDVPKDIDHNKCKEFFAGNCVPDKMLLFGRTYQYFWCKKDKSPQQFVLFAEEGPNLEKMKVSEVTNFCIPQALNPNLDIRTKLKRLKLFFSKTVPTYQLPPGSVMQLPQFGLPNFCEIDGCGLISRAALDKVWAAYLLNIPKEEKSKENDSLYKQRCPYSGFQGRLGGFKGTWVLDVSLGPGEIVQCRDSQHKFNLPQRSLKTTGDSNAANGFFAFAKFYDTMEVCSWDKKPAPATLNTRIIQQLEHVGVPWSFFKDTCSEPELQFISKLLGHGESNASWVNLLKQRQTSSLLKESTDSRKLFRMACAAFPESYPTVVRLKKKIIAEIFSSLRDKAHYGLSDCHYLRMYADHTFLLEEGEVFVALEGCDAPELVAMRSPSYFAGDLRKLKIVPASELWARAKEQQTPSAVLPPELERLPEQKIAFFNGLQNCIVLSNKGIRTSTEKVQSEADRMSGGDYDGDLAWVCWNKELLMHISRPIPAENLTCIKDCPSRLGNRNAWKAKAPDELSYIYGFRWQNALLGQLSECLDKAVDKLGFEDDITRAISRASFLQVDVPDTPLMTIQGLHKHLKRAGLKTPHWMLKGGAFDPSKHHKSIKVLGKLYDALVSKINEVTHLTASHEFQFPPCIESLLIKNSNTDIFKHIMQDMEKAVSEYMAEKAKVWIKMKEQIRNEKTDDDKRADRFSAWKQSYFNQKRRELIDNDCDAIQQINPKIRAAILLKVCLQRESVFRKKLDQTASEMEHNKAGPLEFVDHVCMKELAEIFEGHGQSLLVSSQAEAALMSGR